MMTAIKNIPDTNLTRPNLTIVDALLQAGKIDGDKQGQQAPDRQFLENLVNANPELASPALSLLDVQDEFIGGSSLVPDQYAKLQDSQLAQQIHLRQYAQIIQVDAESSAAPSQSLLNPETAAARPAFDPSQNLQGRTLPQQFVRQDTAGRDDVDDAADEPLRADQAAKFRQEAVIRELSEQQKLSRESQAHLESQILQFKQDKAETLFDINMQVASARQTQSVRINELDDQEPVENEPEIEEERPMNWLPFVLIGAVLFVILLIVLK